MKLRELLADYKIEECLKNTEVEYNNGFNAACDVIDDRIDVLIEALEWIANNTIVIQENSESITTEQTEESLMAKEALEKFNKGMGR